MNEWGASVCSLSLRCIRLLYTILLLRCHIGTSHFVASSSRLLYWIAVLIWGQ